MDIGYRVIRTNASTYLTKDQQVKHGFGTTIGRAWSYEEAETMIQNDIDTTDTPYERYHVEEFETC